MAKASQSTSSSGVEAWLACFGKHPGWNDHIDEQGLETDRLVAVKRILYTEGMTSIVDSGVWEGYAETDRLEGIDHTLFWRAPEGLVTARLWSSRDGKGRAKYPMIVCAQTRGAPFSFVRRTVLNTLGTLEAECKRAGTAGEVITAMDESRSRLRAHAGEQPLVRPTPREERAAVAELAEAPEMGPERVGLYRLLYQIDRDCGPFLKRGKHDSGTRSKMFDIRPQHLRVPRCAEDAGVSADLWMRLLYTLVDPATPVLVCVPSGQPWVDLVVGDPSPSQFSFLRASMRKMPLTTEIPYTLDDEFLARANELVEQAREGRIEELDPGYLPSQRGGATVARAFDSLRDQTGGSRGLPVWVLAAIGAGILVVIVVLVIVLGGGSKDPDDDGSGAGSAGATESSGSTPPRQANAGGAGGGSAGGLTGGSAATGVPGSPAVPTDVSEGWARWCGQADDWLLRFVARADLEAMSRSPYLAQQVVPIIERARAGTIDFDPNTIAGRRMSERRRHIEPLPEVLATAEGQRRVRESLRQISALQTAIAQWPARQTVDALEAEFSARGWSTPAALMSRIRTAATPGESEALGDGLVALIEASQTLGDVAGTVERIESAREPLGAAGDEVLSGYGALADSSLGAMRNADTLEKIANAAQDAEAVADAADRVRQALRGPYQGIDREAFASGARAHRETPETLTPAWLALWATEAADRRYQELDASFDPRGATDARLLALHERLASLVERHGRTADPRLGPDGVGSDLADAEASMVAVREQPWKHATRGAIESATASADESLRDAEVSLDRLSADLSVSADEYLNVARARERVSPTSPPALDAAWRSGRDALLEAFAADSNLLALREGYSELAESLEAVDAALELQSPVERDRLRELGPEAPAAVNRGLEAVRDEAAERLAVLGPARTLAGRPEVAQETARLSAFENEMGTVLGGLIDARERLAALVPPSDGPKAAVAAFDRSSLASYDAFGATAAEIRSLIERIEGVAAINDGARLAVLAVDSSSDPEVAAAAWSRLAEVGGVGVETLAEAASEQRRRIEAVEDPARRETLSAQLDARASAAWLGAATDADEWDTFRGAVRLADAFGIDRGTVPPKVAYRWAVLDLQSLAASGASEDEGAERAAQLVAAVRATGLGGASALSELDALLSGEPVGPVFEPSAAGPGLRGWSGEANDDATRVVYRSPAGATLEFVAAPSESESGRGVFVQARETTVGDLFAIVAAAGGEWSSVQPLFEGHDAEPGTPLLRKGPEGWEWTRQAGGTQRLSVSDDWLGADYLPIRDRYYRTGLDVRAPSEEMPLQFVSPAAASAVASLAGCRLPTQDEWLRAAGDPPAIGETNRRDATWLTQHEYQKTYVNHPVRPRYPDEGAFTPRDLSIAEGFGAGAVSDADDGTLWFRPDDGSGQWYGNVAEYVVDKNDETATPQDAEAWGTAFRSGQMVARVIGGSALSAPEIAVDQAYEVPARAGRWGYADVGFRLAFEADGAAVPGWSVQLSRAVSGLPFSP